MQSLFGGGGQFQLAVIVAMVAVMVVQMALHKVIDVIPMGHCLVAAVCPMYVRFIMAGAFVVRRAFVRICRVHFQAMVVNVIAV